MPPPLADPEPFFDLGKSPLLELSLLLRDLVAFFLVALQHPTSSLDDYLDLHSCRDRTLDPLENCLSLTL